MLGLVGVEDAGPSVPAADQELVGILRMRQAPHGVAGQAQPSGYDTQSGALRQEAMDSRMLFTDAVRQTPRAPGPAVSGGRTRAGDGAGVLIAGSGSRGTVVDDGLLDRFGEVLREMPLVCKVDRVGGASRPASAYVPERSRQINSTPV